MAVLTMKKIHILGLKQDRKAILEYIQSTGTLQVDMALAENSIFKRTNTNASITHYERRSANTEQAIDILNTYVPQKTGLFDSLKGKEDISQEKFQQIIADRHAYNTLVAKIIDCGKEIETAKAGIAKYTLGIEALTPWLSMDIPINTFGTKSTSVFMGSLGPFLSVSEITGILEARLDQVPFYVEVISSDRDQTCIVAICMKKDEEVFEAALRKEGFTRSSFVSSRTPLEKKKKYEGYLKNFQETIDSVTKELEELNEQKGDLFILADYYRIRSEKYQILGNLIQSQNTFLITGYIPEKKEKEIQSHLQELYTCDVEIEEIPEDEQMPIELSNRTFFAAGEGVLTSYGLPHRGEVDPTSIMTLCYIFLFGLMLSDAAYGALIAIACFIMLKKYPKMTDSLAKSLRLFGWCGISTLIWGVLFGGYFGDIVDTVSETYFGHKVTIKALWFVPLNNPMKLLIVSMIIGLIHLFLGLGIKGYQQLKHKDFAGFLGDVLSWFLLVIGLIMMLMPTSMFASIAQVEIKFSPSMKTASYVIALTGALLILLFAGRSQKNPLARLGLGLYGLYDVTSWLSDLLSYSRLLALGLATGVIASVVNMMAKLAAGDSPFGIIIFILIFIVGHTLNLAINLLGAYVHTCRLQYVEFFGKFYEAGGEPFTPFKENTNYIDVTRK